MKMLKHNNYTSLCLTSILLTSLSCTKLEPEVFDRATANQFPRTEQELLSTVGATYGELRGFYDPVSVFNEATTDEMVVPTRGPDWYDNGSWQQMAKHEWTSVSPSQLNGSWEWAYRVIAKANINLLSLKNSTLQINGKDQVVAEVRMLRALGYFWLMDMYGNVPILTEDSPPGNQPQATRQQVYDFVVNEITASIPNLKDEKGVSTYGRFTQAAANFLLAKIYMNAEVYTGTPRWQEAITTCDAIINSPAGYRLNPNFLENFSVNNGNVPNTWDENILAVPYDKVLATGMNWQMRTLHYAQQGTYGLAQAPYNGFSTRADFYNTFGPNDQRKTEWLEGPQLDASGNIITFTDKVDNVNKQLIFTPKISSLEKAFANEGVRNVKYEVQKNNTRVDQDNDFVMFRFADVLLMKAEALLRSGGDAGAAAALINQVRARAEIAPLPSVTLDDILTERGRELAWEGWRRNDLIRFGKWGDPWEFKTNSESFRTLFPIPSQQLSNNPQLKQNPGY